MSSSREPADLAVRDSNGRYLPGQSGNPGGRPKGALRFAQEIHEQTNGSRELWEILLRLARGPTDTAPQRRIVLDSVRELLNRRFGKALQEIHVGGDGAAAIGDALRDISDERLEAALRLLTGAGDEPAPAAPRGVIDAHSRDGGV